MHSGAINEVRKFATAVSCLPRYSALEAREAKVKSAAIVRKLGG